MPPALGTSRLERIGEALPAFARRRNRFTKALCAVAFAAGGEGGARLAQAQAMPASPRTLLRLLESSLLPATSSPRVVGHDEWAWKKGRSYGTIFVDLERKQKVGPLAGSRCRACRCLVEEAFQCGNHRARPQWLVCRWSLTRCAPSAIQVVDRYHVIKNLVEAVERFFLRKRSLLKALQEQQQSEQQ